MFQFPGFAPAHIVPVAGKARRVSPFGHPRVAGYLPLTAAFRSLSRPSSPPGATGIRRAPFLSFAFGRPGSRTWTFRVYQVVSYLLRIDFCFVVYVFPQHVNDLSFGGE